jgi:signal recognition particle subunit SEC65
MSTHEQRKVTSEEYQNKAVINQRGGSIEVNNSTERESVNLTQYSGSNIQINSNVTSELATNNKQTKVNNDSFETVLNNKNVYAGKDYVERIAENSYRLKGFKTDDQIQAAKDWREAYREVANNNSQFEILRGGKSYPAGPVTTQQGERSANPTENQECYVSDTTYPEEAYGVGDDLSPPIRSSVVDEVSEYTKIDPTITENCFKVKNPSKEDIQSAVGSGGYASNSQGAIKYPGKNAATEGGVWAANPTHEQLQQSITEVQEKLSPIEARMGTGGDEEEFIYRDKVENVGATFNNYPNIRVDPEGRSQQNRVAVGKKVTFVNVDKFPHVEEVNNESMFPVGNYTLNVGNKWNVMVGSGGIQLKSTGGVEIGGTTFKVSAQKTNIQSAQGVNITSESIVELQSKNNISLRSNRQVYIEPGLGVANNTVVGGSSYTEGEAYVQHVTAPAEIQKTEDVRLFAKLLNGLKFEAKLNGFADTDNDSLIEAEGTIELIADSNPDKVECEPHSHHFKNLPLRLCESNDDVRAIAQGEGINVDGYKGSAQCVENEYKVPVTVTDENSEQIRVGIEEANLEPRCLFVAPGTKLPNDRGRVQTDGLIKERFEEVLKEGTKPVSSTIQNTEPINDPIAAPLPQAASSSSAQPSPAPTRASAPPTPSQGSSGY